MLEVFGVTIISLDNAITIVGHGLLVKLGRGPAKVNTLASKSSSSDQHDAGLLLVENCWTRLTPCIHLEAPMMSTA